MKFSTWAKKQPRGTLTKMSRSIECSYNTLYLLKTDRLRLSNVSLALKISQYTNGIVSPRQLLLSGVCFNEQ